MSNPKRLLRGQPWAILPEVLHEAIQAAEQPAAEHPDLKAFVDLPTPVDETPFRLERGVAVVDVEGVIVRKQSLLDRIFGGTISTESIQESFDAAMSSDAAAVVLRFDSPGGS